MTAPVKGKLEYKDEVIGDVVYEGGIIDDKPHGKGKLKINDDIDDDEYYSDEEDDPVLAY